MIIPVLPDIIKGFVGGNTALAAQYYGWFGTTWAVMQFFFSPVLGGLSDRFGRRPVVLISNFGLGFDYLLTAVAPTLSWLFLARVVSGITSASISAASAYVADVTPPEQRSKSFGLIGAAFGLGFVIGPAVGGLLAHFDPHLPFWVAGGLSLLNGCYGLFVLPESLPPERRKPFSWKRANPIGSLKLLRAHPQLLALASVLLCAALAHNVLPACFVLYTGSRYHWDKLEFGMSLAAVGIASAIVQAKLVKPISTRLGELRTVVLGLSAGATGFAIYGLASVGAVFLAGIPVMALWGVGTPTVQGMMSRRVDPTEQGALQGAIASLQGIAGIIGPKLFSSILAGTIDSAGLILPGMPFLAAGAMLLVGVAITLSVVRPQQTLEAGHPERSREAT
ncbi:MAG: TCR/Tet family MFS transporter [Archangiaceae bacterium]|nr:TCR/Tet family MFS transporter [Archangiaceae bacterium]